VLRPQPHLHSQLRPRARVIIAGGYTGGHIYCALAIAQGLRRALARVDVLMAGARGGLETRLADAAGFPVATVWISGIERALTPAALARNLLLPLKVVVSQVQAGRILDRFRPHAVVGVGGYASAPVLAAAQQARIPTLVHEANALPGLTNLLLGRHADLVCLGDAEAAAAFPAGRTVVTGNPVRAGLTVPLDGPEARARLGLPDGRTLLVLGGSLGAARLNEWVLGQQRRFAGQGLQVLWQCGAAHADRCRARLEAPGVHLTPFLHDMPTAYAAADLVVAAAGAFTLAELTCLGKPAVIVPARDVAEDHQSHNARALARHGLSVSQDESDERLFERVAALAASPRALAEAGARMRALAQPEATERVVAAIVRLCGGAGAAIRA
jgi:UDP-N-acetylglucosamine--N-acetylmuramyl-(pentapeptide) pyrophosphoryl-undecaprenol N-acetylglucosamine transferase